MSIESDLFEQIRLFLPKYLTADQQRELFSALSQFPDNLDYYLEYQDLPDLLLQGDGWHGFVVIDFATGERKSVAGMILSNSCDVDPENPRDFAVNILFAPAIQVGAYARRLETVGKTAQQVESILGEIRKQHINSLFYVPGCPGLFEESFIALDSIQSHPLPAFLESKPRRLFRLNQYAFYLLLIKLSIHFCRFSEGVKRFPNS